MPVHTLSDVRVERGRIVGGFTELGHVMKGDVIQLGPRVLTVSGVTTFWEWVDGVKVPDRVAINVRDL